ncbi:hypothetical protein BV898_07645 [Hypsibius exemplaris]|uniref:Small integral membrane protein 20 n=1 Tax=Hypsibius exemplaris TaxID=2072580 RepID=A0A1W0WSS2_HYPEX|nr:hypothetical protein BV898_07645 [Hypsibius exemplaris]
MAIRFKTKHTGTTLVSKVLVIGAVAFIGAFSFFVYVQPLLHKKEYQIEQKINRDLVDPNAKHAQGLAKWKSPFEPRVRAD